MALLEPLMLLDSITGEGWTPGSTASQQGSLSHAGTRELLSLLQRRPVLSCPAQPSPGLQQSPGAGEGGADGPASQVSGSRVASLEKAKHQITSHTHHLPPTDTCTL